MGKARKLKKGEGDRMKKIWLLVLCILLLSAFVSAKIITPEEFKEKSKGSVITMDSEIINEIQESRDEIKQEIRDIEGKAMGEVDKRISSLKLSTKLLFLGTAFIISIVLLIVEFIKLMIFKKKIQVMEIMREK